MMAERVEILMGTRNGARYLEPQLTSIAAQRGIDWRLIVSDDRSTDATQAIVGRFAKGHHGRVTLRTGPARGVAANFLSLIAGAGADAEFVALSDQDDIWCAGRLARALAALGTAGRDGPAIYASRTMLLTDAGPERPMSWRTNRRPDFANALVQNILPGNTIVMNRAALELARACRMPPAGVPFHDWWLYTLMTGADARIVVDATPTVHYRQHRANLIGAHAGLAASARRLGGVLSGRYGRWIRQNVAALEANSFLLSPEARAHLDRFSAALDAPSILRGRLIRRSGVFRDTPAGTLCVLGAACLGRI